MTIFRRVETRRFEVLAETSEGNRQLKKETAKMTVDQLAVQDTQNAEVAVGLGPQDRDHLQEVERRCDFIRDRTRSVAERYQNGAYLVGRPGSGKTHTVLTTLQELEACYIYRNSRMSPMGLYEELSDHPEHVIVLDDIPSLLSERQAMQILIAALGGNPGEPRLVTYTRKDERKSFQFRGGIIAISNVPLRQDPLARALSSRMVILEHEPTDDELAAFMRSQALEGFEDLTPGECGEVVEFVIDECRSNEFRMDLRHMKKGFQDRRQDKHGRSSRSWKELVRTSMKQPPRPALSKQQQIACEVDQVEHLMQRYPGDTPRQIQESGLSKSTFYERKTWLKANRQSAENG